MKRRLHIIFAGLLVGGIAGYIAFSGHWPRYVFAHAGGLAIMGFMGLAAGAIAAGKGRNPRLAFRLAFTLPILLGIAAVLILLSRAGRGCGGVVSLAASFLVIAIYGIAGSRSSS